MYNTKTLAFHGAGSVYFQHPNQRYAQSNSLERAGELETIDFQNFVGDILFSKKMFGSTKPILSSVLFGELSNVTEVKERAFTDCKQLSTFDLSKVNGPIGVEAFRNTALTEADLSNVTSIGYAAFDNVNGVSDWSSICDAADKGVLKKLEYSNVFLKTDRVWTLVQREMDGKFSLNQDGSYQGLKPSDNGWESSQLGESNQIDPGSTQLTKSAKWTDQEKTTAQIEIQASYAPDQQMDFIFIVDTSTSMKLVNADDTALNKMYQMLSKVADVVDSLLLSKEVDSRVAILSFGDMINDYSAGFFTEETVTIASKMIRNLQCAGNTDFAVGLENAVKYIETAKGLNRKVSIVFLSDGEANQDVDQIDSAAKQIEDLGVETIGVIYKMDPNAEETQYMEKVCSEYYVAKDTEGFSNAVNRTIYDAFRTFTLTDKIGTDFQKVTADDISVTGGTFKLDTDGRTISWDLSGTEPYQTYTMMIHTELEKDTEGKYPEKTVLTNDGNSVLTETKGDNTVNQVASPQLDRAPKIGNLTVSKTVSGSGADTAKEFVFTVTLNDKTVNKTYGDMDFKDGAASFKLKHGDKITAIGLPADMTYEVSEDAAGYTATSTGATGKIKTGETVTAAFHNYKDDENSGGDNGGNDGGTVISGVTLHFESNGGTVYSNESYSRSSVVKLDKLPVREGYQFTGWYADQKLTQKITEIVMTSDKTVYAGWKETKVPDLLNGDNHFAYIVGYPNGNVEPMGNITRAETATIFFRLLKDEVRDGNLSNGSSFKDVGKDSWCNTSVSTMAKLGIIKGRMEDKFDPQAPITRAEFAAICARFDTGLTDGNNNFSDIAGHWAEVEIKRAAAKGWVQGDPDGKFRPDDCITRAEAMAMINRVLCRIPESESDLLDGMNIWPDNQPGNWYYLAVQEATNSHEFKRKSEVNESWTKLKADPNWIRYQ